MDFWADPNEVRAGVPVSVARRTRRVALQWHMAAVGGIAKAPHGERWSSRGSRRGSDWVWDSRGLYGVLPVAV